jgi:hypothetical protein
MHEQLANGLKRRGLFLARAVRRVLGCFDFREASHTRIVDSALVCLNGLSTTCSSEMRTKARPALRPFSLAPVISRRYSPQVPQ